MSALPFTIAPLLSQAAERETSVSPWGEDVERILCVRLDRLGDILMTTPAIHALRASMPRRRITLLTSTVGAMAAPFLRDVDEVIAYDAPWHGLGPTTSPQNDLAMQRRLEAGRFDAAVIFTVYSQSALPAAMLCYLAGIPHRLAHCRENPYGLLTDWVCETEPHGGVRHEVERQLALVAKVGATCSDTRMRFDLGAKARAAIAERLAARGIAPEGPWFVIHPGASAPSRRYPPERFGAVAARLAQSTRWPILLTGSADEASLIRELIAAAGPSAHPYLHDLSGLLNMEELAALIERATVLVSNNSGPVHLASALATPVVDLYALTNPQHTPWKTPHRVLFRDVDCRWCYRGVCPQGHHQCLLGVPSEEVANAALELAAGRGRPIAQPRANADANTASALAPTPHTLTVAGT
ncbi:MAG TPA: lipopolysaccharide heptosyltransferase II [Trinickia sp.]|uniref:lipopolysaccharide heptosyltransferase II n=1 Tax=Trinickia sp. TaxID=2571163 RepID=UPI002BA7F3A2|nr:lipopolysaccharide heptosyltransferase II [Trinickia sp.]HVW53541.1 lipopolysaccharide heptosyltransferase II [Trinickia sp.]